MTVSGVFTLRYLSNGRNSKISLSFFKLVTIASNFILFIVVKLVLTTFVQAGLFNSLKTEFNNAADQLSRDVDKASRVVTNKWDETRQSPLLVSFCFHGLEFLY